MSNPLRRLRLVVRRHALPEVRVLFNVSLEHDPTIANFLEQVNEVIPLESNDWGLEDYVVELQDAQGSAFECLHFQPVSSILQADEEVFIRPLFTGDLKKRVLSGRHQISAEGKHLIDGVAFGRSRLRVPRDRPTLDIPPLKRRRLTYHPDEEAESHLDEDDGEYNPLLLTNGEQYEESDYEPSLVRDAMDSIDDDEDVDADGGDLNDLDLDDASEDEDMDVDDQELAEELRDLQQDNEVLGDDYGDRIDKDEYEDDQEQESQNDNSAEELRKKLLALDRLASLKGSSGPGSPQNSVLEVLSTLVPDLLDGSLSSKLKDDLSERLDKIAALRPAFPEVSVVRCQEALKLAKEDLEGAFLALEQSFSPRLGVEEVLHRFEEYAESRQHPIAQASGSEAHAVEGENQDDVEPRSGVPSARDDAGDDDDSISSESEVESEPDSDAHNRDTEESDSDGSDSDGSDSDESDSESVSSVIKHYDQNGFPAGSVLDGTASRQLAKALREKGEEVKLPVHQRFDDAGGPATHESVNKASHFSADSSSDDEENSSGSSNHDDSSSSDDDDSPEVASSKPPPENLKRQDSDKDDASSSSSSEEDDSSDDDPDLPQDHVKLQNNAKDDVNSSSNSEEDDSSDDDSDEGAEIAVNENEDESDSDSSSESSSDESSSDSSSDDGSDDSESDANIVERIVSKYQATTQSQNMESSNNSKVGANAKTGSAVSVNQQTVRPGEGKNSTKNRNARKKKALQMRKARAEAEALAAQEAKPQGAIVQENTSNAHEVDEALLARKSALLANLNVAFENSSKQSEVDDTSDLPSAMDGTDEQSPEVAADTTPSSASSQRRAKLDAGAGRRMIFGALGLRNPKTKADEEKIKAKLMEDVRVHVNPRLQEEAPPKENQLVEDDPEAWRDKITYRAVECCQEGVQLSEPPFPFVQRWDPQQRPVRRGRNKRKHRSQPELYEDDGYGVDVHGPGDQGEGHDHPALKKRRVHYEDVDEEHWDASMYDDAVEGDTSDPLDQNDGDRDETMEVPNNFAAEMSQFTDLEDLPSLPKDLTTLPQLKAGEARPGMVITWKQLRLSEATKWQPEISDLTAVVTNIEPNLCLRVILAVRDRGLDGSEKRFDDDGNRIYGKFEAPDLDDGEADENSEGDLAEGELIVDIADLMDPRIVQQPLPGLLSDPPQPDADEHQDTQPPLQSIEEDAKDHDQSAHPAPQVQNQDVQPISSKEQAEESQTAEKLILQHEHSTTSNAQSTTLDHEGSQKVADQDKDSQAEDIPATGTRDENAVTMDVDVPADDIVISDSNGAGMDSVDDTRAGADNTDSSRCMIPDTNMEMDFPGHHDGQEPSLPEVADDTFIGFDDSESSSHSQSGDLESALANDNSEDLDSPSRQLDEELSDALSKGGSSISPSIPSDQAPQVTSEPEPKPASEDGATPKPDASSPPLPFEVPESLGASGNNDMVTETQDGLVEYPKLDLGFPPSSPGSGRQPDPDFNVSLPNDSFSQLNGSAFDAEVEPEPPSLDKQDQGKEDGDKIPTKSAASKPTPVKMIDPPKESPAMSVSSVSTNEFPARSSLEFSTAPTSRHRQTPSKVLSAVNARKPDVPRDLEYEEAMRQIDEGDESENDTGMTQVKDEPTSQAKKALASPSTSLAKKLLDKPIEKSAFRHLPWKKSQVLGPVKSERPLVRSTSPIAPLRDPFGLSASPDAVKICPLFGASPSPDRQVRKPKTDFKKEFKPGAKNEVKNESAERSAAPRRARRGSTSSKFSIPEGSQVVSLLSNSSDSDVGPYEEDYADDSIDGDYETSSADVKKRKRGSTAAAAPRSSLPSGSGWVKKANRGSRGVSLPSPTAPVSVERVSLPRRIGSSQLARPRQVSKRVSA